MIKFKFKNRLFSCMVNYIDQFDKLPEIIQINRKDYEQFCEDYNMIKQYGYEIKEFDPEFLTNVPLKFVD